MTPRISLFGLAVALLGLPAVPRLGAAEPVAIGRSKQLLIDDHVVGELDGVSRVFNPAEKSISNPVLTGDRPWEGRFVYVGTVLYDDEDAIFKMWYWAAHLEYRTPTKPFAQYSNLLQAAHYHESFSLCYATSRDGLHWDKPNLGLVEFQGSKANNLLPPVSDGRMHNYAGIIKDRHDRDPARRYKAVAWRPKDKNGVFGVGVYFSPDGLRWTAYAGNPVIRGTSDVHTLLGWDNRLQRYVAYFRPGLAQHLTAAAGSGLTRIIGYSTSEDFEHWTPIIPALVPDKLDPVDTQFYGMPAVSYEGMVLGFPWVFRTNLITHVPQFVYSRDGLHFTRTPFRQDFLPLGPTGSFDDGNAYVVRPVAHADKLWFYYTGTRWRGTPDLFELGDAARDSIGLATLPLDGYVSIEAGPNPGTLRTRPLIFSGGTLTVNIEASRKGYGIDEGTSVQVEVLGADGRPIPGFGLQDSEPATQTNVRQVMTWKGHPDLAALAGQGVTLRFTLRNVKLYAFQFQ
jgi:hypothetical protein